MKKKIILSLAAFLLVAIVPIAWLLSLHPIFSHAATTGCTTQTIVPASSGVINLPFDSFPSTSSSSSSISSTNAWAQAWGVSSSGGWGWDDMSTSCDTSVSSGSVLNVHYAAHSSAPSCNCGQGGGQFYSFFKNSTLMSSLSSASTVYLQYYVKFPTNFDFGKAAKLPGLFGGSSTGVSGGNHSTDAWSTRLMWRTSSGKGAQGEVYVYDPTETSGDGTDLGLGKWTFQADNQWHPVEQSIQSSAQGATVTMWYDGQKVFSSPISTTGIPTAGIFFSTFFGGHTSDWGPQQDEDMSFTNFQVSKQYIPLDMATVSTLNKNTSITQQATATPTATATATATQCATGTFCLSGQDSITNVATQGYAYPDNNDGAQVASNTAAIAYPKSGGFPTLHDQATEGTGTYDDPITFAAYTPLTEGTSAVFAPGTKIYVPYLEKYFILEDECGDCNQAANGNTYTLHLWLGPSSPTAQDTTSSISACETTIAQQTSGIVINPLASYPVEQTPLYSNGTCTAKIFTGQISSSTSTATSQATSAATSQATSTATSQATSAATSQATSASSTSSDGKTYNVAVTSFGFPDNDNGSGQYGTSVIAFPKSDGYPTLHNVATEGTGTYNDPTTFAAYTGDTEGSNATFPPGTRIYVPYLEKYFILEDQCAGCNDASNGNSFHIDLWLGPSTPGSQDTAQSIEACEGEITHDSEQIIINPTADHPVNTTALYKNGTCSAKQY